VNQELHRGNVLLLKRPLADFVCILSAHEVGGKIRVRYLDSPPEDSGVIVAVEDVIKLAEAQERELPTEFMEAVEKQRRVVFTPKPVRGGKGGKKVGVGGKLKGMSDDTYAQILQILADDK
jgi:hypothetical protein